MREWVKTRIKRNTPALIVASAIISFILGAYAGVLFHANAEAFGRSIVAVESPATPTGRCLHDVWTVMPGDRVDNIIRRCYPGENLLAVKDEMRALNPHIESLGVIHPDDELHMPERGRR